MIYECNLRETLVYRRPGVVERRCLQDDATGAGDTSHCEYPQEESVQHHCHVLPVLHNLKTNKILEMQIALITESFNCEFFFLAVP